MRIILLTVLGALLAGTAQAQYLSNLHATKDDPIFATYAAPMSRSNYIIDEGYRFVFYDDEKGVRFTTDDAGDLGVAFRLDDDVVRRLDELAEEPVITTSYSDLVKYQFKPFEDVRVDAFFQVYSSSYSVHRLNVTNERSARIELDVIPFLHHADSIWSVETDADRRFFTFAHDQPLDGWMRRKKEKIPYIPERADVLMLDEPADEIGAYPTFDAFLQDLGRGILDSQTAESDTSVLAFSRSLTIEPGTTASLRIVRGVRSRWDPLDSLIAGALPLTRHDMEAAVRDAEATYSRIPRLAFEDPEREMMYWSAFSLIRQLFMPPEGKTKFNHYVYSREPIWGWGYAGQVLHESITMLAYVFMDAESAQNSQRVYMQRQWPNGYIYYRIGPYLDEHNLVRGQVTSSAPWYNWENWEIYLETGDRVFLDEAYASGSAFYNWWMDHRDSDGDGLMEWGGHAILESIRDAKVALWRDVAWPSNFESPDLNAMLVVEARSLANIADELGRPDEAEAWRLESTQRAEAVRDMFWDEEDGFFYYLDKRDNDFTYDEPNDIKRMEITGFMPLWAGIATEEQAEQLVKHLTDPEKFWRPYGIPSLAADDSFYDPQGYWNGPVWVELNYLIFRGLIDYGYHEEARELAERVFTNVIHHLKKDHTLWEFYSPESLWAGYHHTYIWTGIVARMLIDLERLESRN